MPIRLSIVLRVPLATFSFDNSSWTDSTSDVSISIIGRAHAQGTKREAREEEPLVPDDTGALSMLAVAPATIRPSASAVTRQVLEGQAAGGLVSARGTGGRAIPCVAGSRRERSAVHGSLGLAADIRTSRNAHTSRNRDVRERSTVAGGTPESSRRPAPRTTRDDWAIGR